MLTRVIEWSIGNRFFVVLGAVSIAFGGIYALRAMPLDALPDLSDVQVIIFTDYPGQAPQVVEDQVTYPITTQMLAVPSATVVRGYSFFGFSFVYVIFEDGTDLYWARSRVLEYLNYVGRRLPQGVAPTLGPDATGVGWAYTYALRSNDVDRERAPASGARPRPPAPLADRHPRRHRGRSHPVLRAAGHHHLVRAHLHAGGAGRPALQAARVHQDLRHGGLRPALRDARPGAGRLLDSRPHPAGAGQPDHVAAPGAVPAGAAAGAGLALGGRRRDSGGDGGDRRAVLAAGVRVHAPALGGRPALHAHDPAGHIDHQGPRGRSRPASTCCRPASRPRWASRSPAPT